MGTSGPTIEWEYGTDGHVLHRPVLCGKYALVATVGGDLHAIEKTTGERGWTRQLPGPVTASPVVIDDIVYSGCCDGTLAAHATEDGTEIWRAEIAADITGLSVTESVLVAQSDSGGVCVVDRTTGDQRWLRRGADIGSIDVVPAVPDDQVVGWLAPDVIAGLDPLAGEDLWAHHTKRTRNRLVGQIQARGDLFVPATEGVLHVVDPSSGERVRTSAFDSPVASLAADGTDVFCVTDDGGVYELVDTGKTRLFDLSSTTSSSETYHAFLDGHVLYVGTDECLFAIDTDGTLRWRADLGHGPVLATSTVDHSLATLVDQECVIGLDR
jgi:outer membrane protein assembly factor BamB